MTIVYDDLIEFYEVRSRCERTRNKKKCTYCPFFDRCEDDNEFRLHTTRGEIRQSEQKEREQE